MENSITGRWPLKLKASFAVMDCNTQKTTDAVTTFLESSEMSANISLCKNIYEEKIYTNKYKVKFRNLSKYITLKIIYMKKNLKPKKYKENILKINFKEVLVPN
jgi:hypothetical protein